MAKKKTEDAPINKDGWMATFSDLMNLLLCFFVMLYSMSNVDEGKWAELVASLQSSISIFNAGSSSIGDGILISNGVSQLNELDQYINSTGKSADSENDSDNFQENDLSGGISEEDEMQAALEKLEQEKLQSNEELAEKIEEALAENRIQNQIEVTVTADHVQLSIRGALMFDSARVDIKEEAIPVLEKVVLILERYAEDIIEIEGHTDNIPISNGIYSSNTELSCARAISIYEFLLANSTLDPSLIKPAGRGEYAPIADNSTEAGRARNRRVEIRIFQSAR